MARHPQLEANQFDLLKQIFASGYPSSKSETIVDFLSSDTKIEIVNSGRLSFVFIAKQNEDKVFLKIVKPGYVKDNIPFSVLCTEEFRLHSSIPTFKTYRGGNGELHQIVPAQIEGMSSESLALFSGQTMTLTEAAKEGIDTIPEALSEIPGGQKGQLALMETLGGYIVKVSRAMTMVTQDLPYGIDTTDPAGFKVGREVACKNFGISEAQTFLKNTQDREALQKHIQTLLPNLGSSSSAQSFKRGLERGDLEKVLDTFNQLEQQINQSLEAYPSPDVPIHNEVKPANVGAVYDQDMNQWSITQSFDFDNIGFGTKENGDRTPLEKDLGRTLSFFAFDAKTGEFYPQFAKATIKGFLERLPKKLNSHEIDRIKGYIKLGVVTSYFWRASYLAEELQGFATDIQLARPDPSIHLVQLDAFDSWLENSDFNEMIAKLQNTHAMEQHHQISQDEVLFRNSATYQEKRAGGQLKSYSQSIDEAHDHINLE